MPSTFGKWFFIFYLAALVLNETKSANFNSKNKPAAAVHTYTKFQISSILIRPVPGTPAKNTTTINETLYPVLPGHAIQLFPRYGYLSLSMRIVSRNESANNWLFLEPSKPIFDPTTYQIKTQQISSSSEKLATLSTPALQQNQFHIDICEDMDQLFEAYFNHFKIEGTSPRKSWKAFSGGWQLPSIIRYFGFEPEFIPKANRDNLSYVLVRLLFVHNHGTCKPFQNISLIPEFKEQLPSFDTNDPTSSYKLFNSIGSHFISSYLTGNSLYQVFLFDTNTSVGFDMVKQHLSRDKLTPSFGPAVQYQLNSIPKLLTTWATHIGKVMILNANAQITQSIQLALKLRSMAAGGFYPYQAYSNIFKMYNNPKLVSKIEAVLRTQHDGLIGLELKMMDFIFDNQTQKKWYLEAMQQTIGLWENNL